jgi:hypothetical protein
MSNEGTISRPRPHQGAPVRRRISIALRSTAVALLFHPQVHQAGEALAPPLPRISDYPSLKNLEKVYVVSPAGDDANPGSAELPFRSISRAARVLVPGQGVLVRDGIYRERVAPERGGEPGRPIVYQAERGHRVFIKGSDLWKPAWPRVKGSIYSAVPDEAMFTDDAYWDSANPLRVAVSATPWGREGRAEYEYFIRPGKNQNKPLADKADRNLVFTLGQVFVDGEMLRQVPYMEELEATADAWFFDPESGKVFIHLSGTEPPERRGVELTTRRRIFAPHHRGLGHIHVLGFVMEHCGNQYPKDFWSIRENAQAGAMGTRSGHHWRIEDNIIRHANGIGLDVGREGPDSERLPQPKRKKEPVGDHAILSNRIADNGAGGICGWGPKRLRITGNVVERNNNLRFKGKKRFESAGIKLHTPDDSWIADNLFRDNFTHGFWGDEGIGKGLRFTRNVILGNAGSEHGVFIEMGVYGPDTGFIDNNIIIGNRNGYYCHDGSGVTVSHNLIANSMDHGIHVQQVGPRCNTRNHSFYNNLLIGNAKAINLNFPADLGGDVRLNSNVYDAAETDRVFLINRNSKFNPSWSDDEFRALVPAGLKPGAINPVALVDRGVAKLTFAEWRTFWSMHSEESDDRSILHSSATVAVNDETLEIRISGLTAHTATAGQGLPGPSRDILGEPIGGEVIAGPFQRAGDRALNLQIDELLDKNIRRDKAQP